jgi:nucleolysin TIA-1/TIAR
MYGMPQPNTYGQYGFAGYPTGAPGAGSPGMPQATPGGGGLGLAGAGQQGGGDPNTAQGAQQQWPAGTDPSAYYSNYWGGEHRFHVCDIDIFF